MIYYISHSEIVSTKNFLRDWFESKGKVHIIFIRFTVHRWIIPFFRPILSQKWSTHLSDLCIKFFTLYWNCNTSITHHYKHNQFSLSDYTKLTQKEQISITRLINMFKNVTKKETVTTTTHFLPLSKPYLYTGWIRPFRDKWRISIEWSSVSFPSILFFSHAFFVADRTFFKSTRTIQNSAGTYICIFQKPGFEIVKSNSYCLIKVEDSRSSRRWKTFIAFPSLWKARRLYVAKKLDMCSI